MPTSTLSDAITQMQYVFHCGALKLSSMATRNLKMGTEMSTVAIKIFSKGRCIRATDSSSLRPGDTEMDQVDAPPILRSFPLHSILHLHLRTPASSARCTPRARPPPPPPLRSRRAQPLPPLWRSSTTSASSPRAMVEEQHGLSLPPGRSAGVEEVVVPAEHSDHCLDGLVPLLGLRSW
jgi:hypothetical protein